MADNSDILKNSYETFLLAGGKVIVGVDDLTAIQRALRLYLRHSADDEQASLATELDQAPQFIDENGLCHIGSWLLQAHNNELRLTHHPAGRNPIMRLDYAVISKKDDVWHVERLGTERIRGI